MPDTTFDEVTKEELDELEIEWASVADEVYARQYDEENQEGIDLPW